MPRTSMRMSARTCGVAARYACFARYFVISVICAAQQSFISRAFARRASINWSKPVS